LLASTAKSASVELKIAATAVPAQSVLNTATLSAGFTSVPAVDETRARMSPAGCWFLAIAWLRRLAWPKQRRRWSRPRVHQSTTAATGWTLAAAADGMASLQCEAFPSLLTSVSSAAVGVTPSAGAVVATTCFTHPIVAQAGIASTGYSSAGEGDPTCMVTLTASPV